MVIKSLIEKAIEKYNKYRSPEATAKLVSFSEKSFVVEFSGSFCKTCGFYDYFDDFRIVLGEFGIKVKIKEIRETEAGGIVKYEVEK